MLRFSPFLLYDCQDAWRSLIRRPLRSLLSGLGIGIGVAALIAMLAITEGGKMTALAKFSSLGLSSLRVESLPSQEGKQNNTANLSQGLVLEDCLKLEEWLGTRGKVGLFAKREGVRVVVGGKADAAHVLGVTEGWFAAEELQVAAGRLLSPTDIVRRERYCVVGSELANTLGIGVLSTIQVEQQVLTVIGVAAKKGRLLTEGTGLSAVDFDNSLILPYGVMPSPRMVADRQVFDGLVIRVAQDVTPEIRPLAEQVRQLLLANHRQIADFLIIVPRTLLQESEASKRMFSLIMSAIAALSLLVGGIGVMNIMLANIAEQTREIGLRMAVGASPRRIVRLYLCYSVMLCLGGAVWGLLIGVCVAAVIERTVGLPVAFSWVGVFLAPAFAIVTGVLFGLYPAGRAAALEPALALRDS